MTRKEIEDPTEVEIELKRRLGQLTDHLIQKQAQVFPLNFLPGRTTIPVMRMLSLAFFHMDGIIETSSLSIITLLLFIERMVIFFWNIVLTKEWKQEVEVLNLLV